MAEIKSVQICLDAKLKEDADQVFHEMGLTMAAAITLFIKQTVIQRRMPFEIVADPFFSEENQNVLKESLKQFEQGKTKTHKQIGEDED